MFAIRSKSLGGEELRGPEGENLRREEREKERDREKEREREKQVFLSFFDYIQKWKEKKTQTWHLQGQPRSAWPVTKLSILLTS